MKKITKFIKEKSSIFLALFALVIIPLFSGCGTASTYSVNLEIWGTMDESLVYDDIITQYKKINPYVGQIKYRKFSQDTYKQELLDALASGKGPDIFMIGNSWLPSFKNKLSPAPTPIISEQDIKNNFPDVVDGDFVDAGMVYASPLTIDSMALYYNKDMFNAVGITAPPKNWVEFQDDVQKITKLNPDGNFDVSGAAIGTGINVNRSADLLTSLMMQNGVVFPNAKGVLSKIDEGVVAKNGSVIQPGEQALNYYTNFAKLNSSTGAVNPSYSWNSKQLNSVEAFARGSVAMMFNYSWQIANLKNKNPKLNFAVAPMPQIDSNNPATYASYWGYGVSSNKIAQASPAGSAAVVAAPSNDLRIHEAWQFLKFLTLKNSATITLYNGLTKASKDVPVTLDAAKDYLKKTSLPAARRDLIEAQKSDTTLGVFAISNLFAKHYYQVDEDMIDKIFSDMIESVNRGEVTLHEALLLAKNKINSLSSK